MVMSLYAEFNGKKENLPLGAGKEGRDKGALTGAPRGKNKEKKRNED